MFRLARSIVAMSSLAVISCVWGADPSAEAIIERYQLEQADTPVKDRPGWRKPARIVVGGFVAQMIGELRKEFPGIEFVAAAPGQIAQQAATADALFGLCNAEALAAGKSIQWIHFVTAGVENCVSVPGVKERDILVTNMQRIGGPIIAEHVMAMTLAFTRGLDLYVPQQAKHEWKRVTPPGRMAVVKDKTMLVVGLAELNNSGAAGVAVLTDKGDGTTDVSVYVTENEEGHGHDMASPTDGGAGTPADNMGGMDMGTPGASSGSVTVNIQGFSFGDPITIPVGTTVTFVNKDATAHTVTDKGGTFQSNKIDPGASWSYTFNTAGTYTYFCEYHANMVGTIIVQ